MEPQNLDSAKEEARRSNWTQVLPASYQESEDEIPNVPSATSIVPIPGSSTMMNWDELIDDPQVAIDDDYTTAESNRLDEDEDDKTYESEGKAMEMSEFGLIQSRVSHLLKSENVDFKSLSERKVQINLSFIKDQTTQLRVKSIVENVIKKYTSIPGQVEIDSANSAGIYVFNVTNPYLSPKSISSEEPECHKDLMIEPKPETSEIYKDLIDQLMNGIQLTPKVPGLPKKTLRYGDYKLIKENIGKIIHENPNKTWEEIIEIALKLSGDYKKVFNLYKF